MAKTRGIRARVRAFARGILVGSAVLYPVLLLVVIALFALIGERWWVTALALYLPRAPLALPLPLLVLLLAIFGPRRLLWLQALALGLVLFPLMGFVMPKPRLGKEPGPTLRVVSCNVNSGFGGYSKIGQRVASLEPDVILLQELFINPDELVKTLKASFAHVEVSTQFLVASHSPLVSTTDPEKLPFSGRARSPRFMQYVIDTKIGRVAFYNVHPISPRGAFTAARGNGLRRQILSGRLFSGEADEKVSSYGDLRELQLETACGEAKKERYPTVFAGDLNLVGLSPVLRGCLSSFRDGFEDAGQGFGYTYPINSKGIPPWMRLDRILSSDTLHFTHFEVLSPPFSDHLCVFAELVQN